MIKKHRELKESSTPPFPSQAVPHPISYHQKLFATKNQLPNSQSVRDPKSSSHTPNAGAIKEILNKRGLFIVILCCGERFFS